MNQYQAKNIINLAVAGHGGAGKTSLAEAMLYLAGVSDRRGKVGEGNTVCDYDPEEIRRKASISAASAPLEWKNKKINLLDAPGLFDFEGGMCEAMRAADTALIVVSGRDGVAVGTEKAFAAAEKNGLAKIFFVNGLCDESARFYRVFEDLKANFGPSVCPVVVPFIQDGQANIYINLLEYKAYDYSGGKPVAVAMPDMGDRLEGLRTAIYEAVAETDDELFEKYLAGEPFTPEEVIVGVSKGVKSGTITPVFCGDALLMRGMEQFMDGLCWLAPSAEEKAGEIGLDVDGSPVELSVNEDGAAAAIVFKTVADPFIGKLSYVKVVSGKISTDSQLVNMRTGNTERVGKTVMMVGKKQMDVKYIGAGDIGAIPKLSATNTGDTLCSPTRKVTLDGVEYPNPTLRMAIVPAKKGEEDKIAQGLMRLSEEDPTLQFATNNETHEMILSGLGEQHLDVAVSKLKTKFGVDVSLKKPKVPYRETIRKKAVGEGRHKKQSGGHGQFGHVFVEFEPDSTTEEMRFEEKVFGGAVPRQYFPAVESGLRECCEHGYLAGYKMVQLKATLLDGKYHDVDSSEMAFKLAARLAYKDAMEKCSPILLEPIMNVEVRVPDEYTGTIIGDFNKRRGSIMGMDLVDGYQIISAQVPMAEMMRYPIDLRAMTQGMGSYTQSFDRYDPVPSNLAERIVAAARAEMEE